MTPVDRDSCYTDLVKNIKSAQQYIDTIQRLDYNI